MSADKIVPIKGPETRFVEAIRKIVDETDDLTVHQICGGLFAVAHDVLSWAQEDPD
jgi:hypothetical protein